MRELSNNHHRRSLPFTDIQIPSTKAREDDPGYDSLPNQYAKQSRINSIANLSSSSSLSNEIHHITSLVKNIPSPTDISTIQDAGNTTSDAVQYAVQLCEKIQPSTTSTPNQNRKRVRPVPAISSDSADSFALSNRVVIFPSSRQQPSQVAMISSIGVPTLARNVKYVHNNHFDSSTKATVDHVEKDIINIELEKQQQEQQQQQPSTIFDTLAGHKQQFSWIDRLGESIRLLPANVLAIVFIGLIGGLFVSVIFVIIIV